MHGHANEAVWRPNRYMYMSRVLSISYSEDEHLSFPGWITPDMEIQGAHGMMQLAVRRPMRSLQPPPMSNVTGAHCSIAVLRAACRATWKKSMQGRMEERSCVMPAGETPHHRVVMARGPVTYTLTRTPSPPSLTILEPKQQRSPTRPRPGLCWQMGGRPSVST